MKRDEPDAALLTGATELPAAAEIVVEALQPLLSEERVARIDAVIAGRTRSVVPVLEAVDDPRNVAAVLRSADAFGAQEVHLIEGQQPFLAARRVTQGAELWLDLIRHRSPEDCVASLRARGFRIVLATMDGELDPEHLCAIARLAIVFGNERDGTSEKLSALCDARYRIPMRGFAQSLNVSVAAAITLHAAMRGRPGDLDALERAALRARFMMIAVPRAMEVVREHLERIAR